MSGRSRPVDSGRQLFDHDLAFDSPLVAGVDEAGRGCLAGPIVAAAVLFDRSCLEGRGGGSLAGLRDSKKLAPKARVRLLPEIMRQAVRVSVVQRSARFIDDDGLQRANIECLATALAGIDETGSRRDVVRLVDGFDLGECGLEHRRLVKGDSLSATVAAASIVAKVTRDRLMVRAERRYPGYGFDAHKGYASAGHREAIVRLGPSPIHRLSFDSPAYRDVAAGRAVPPDR